MYTSLDGSNPSENRFSPLWTFFVMQHKADVKMCKVTVMQVVYTHWLKLKWGMKQIVYWIKWLTVENVIYHHLLNLLNQSDKPAMTACSHGTINPSLNCVVMVVVVFF